MRSHAALPTRPRARRARARRRAAGTQTGPARTAGHRGARPGTGRSRPRAVSAGVAGEPMLYSSAYSAIHRMRPLLAEGAMLPKTSSWRYSHGATTIAKAAAQPTAATSPIWRALPGHSSHSAASAKGMPSSMPSDLASVARPTTAPPMTNARRSPRIPRAHSHRLSAPSVMNSPKLSGCPKNGVKPAGTATSRPAASAAWRLKPASRPMN